jgi:hypothetical protein
MSMNIRIFFAENKQRPRGPLLGGGSLKESYR